MSTAYNGLPGNEARKGQLSVTGATNAIAPNPIIITTSVAHGLAYGELVQIVSVEGNTAANGLFYVAPTSGTQFGLYTTFTGGVVGTPVAGSGAWTLGGIVIPLAWNAASTLPDDGDALNASSVNTPLEGNFDREAWLVSRLGTAQIMSIDEDATGTAPGALWGGQAIPAVAWSALPALIVSYTGLYGGVIHAAPSDVVKVEFTGALQPTVACAVRLVVQFANYDGTGVTGVVNGPSIDVPATGVPYPLSLLAYATNAASNGRRVYVSLQYFGIAAPGAIQWQGAGNMHVTVLRSAN